MKILKIAALAAVLVAPAVSAQAGQSVNLILNWTPAADHSPFYYAKAQGWYEKAGIDLAIEVGKGSGVSSLKVGSGAASFGISDLATMLVARSKGADAVAFSAVQMSTGEVADLDAIARAADETGALTMCDATQAVGWLPLDGRAFDAARTAGVEAIAYRCGITRDGIEVAEPVPITEKRIASSE